MTDESNVPIKVPFDPNLIKIKRDPFTIGQLIDKMEFNEVNFETAFQRKADLWDTVKQSRLIESVLLNLPLPAFYFDEVLHKGEDGEPIRYWQVIDGLQRCSTFNNFLLKQTLALQQMEFLAQYNGKTFKELPGTLQRRIKQTSITVYILEQGTPEEVKFNIFKRINTGGLILSPQEIRHAMNQGVAADFVADLADLPLFKEATCGAINTNRMEDRDFVTRYISFYLQGYETYQPDLDSFMTKGMGLIKTLTEVEKEKMKSGFNQAMHVAIEIFGDDAFRKRNNWESRRMPLNKALFEVFSVAFSKLSAKERQRLINHKLLFRQKFIELNQDAAFWNAVSAGTGQSENVVLRHRAINQIINQIVEEAE